MEFWIVTLILLLAIHQFWTGHKKDLAGNIKAGRWHMALSVVLIFAGVLVIDITR